MSEKGYSGPIVSISVGALFAFLSWDIQDAHVFDGRPYDIDGVPVTLEQAAEMSPVYAGIAALFIAGGLGVAGYRALKKA